MFFSSSDLIMTFLHKKSLFPDFSISRNPPTFLPPIPRVMRSSISAKERERKTAMGKKRRNAFFHLVKKFFFRLPVHLGQTCEKLDAFLYKNLYSDKCALLNEQRTKRSRIMSFLDLQRNCRIHGMSQKSCIICPMGFPYITTV